MTKGDAMRLVDLIAHGGSVQSDGNATPVTLQAATQCAQQWLEGIALKTGQMIDGALWLNRPDDITLAFNEMPEDFVLV